MSETPEQRTRGPDMRRPGEDWCADCPDREGCWLGYRCDVVRKVAEEAARRQHRID